MTSAAPGRVLRLAVIGWGFGHLALGRRRTAAAWLAAEVAALVAVAATTVLWAQTTWYLVPFLAGSLFIGLWVVQATLAYRAAQASAAALPPTPRGSPAGVAAWLTVPMLVWGTGFWLIGASAGSPQAVLDRFVTAWPEVTSGEHGWDDGLALRPAQLTSASGGVRQQLEALCASGALAEDCATAPKALLRDVRIRLLEQDATHALALAEVVRYERVPTTLLGIFPGTEQVAIPTHSLLRLELETRAAAGAERWLIVNAQRG